MNIKDIIAIVFSSTLLSTMITVLFNLLSNRRKELIENITKERKEWRDQLRVIAKTIAKSKNKNQLNIAISELKVRINAYGITKDSIFYDSHFWKQINNLESNSTLANKELKKVKTYFVNQISCILKYDWERSKAEIKGNTQTKIVIASLATSFILYSIRWFYYYNIGISKIVNYISYCVLYILIVAFSSLVIYFADKWKNGFHFKIYIVFSLIGGILLYLFVFISIPSARPFDIIDYIINLSPYATLLFCAELKMLVYRKNTRCFIIATAISSETNTIDEKYKVFIGKEKLINIPTGEVLSLSKKVYLKNETQN